MDVVETVCDRVLIMSEERSSRTTRSRRSSPVRTGTAFGSRVAISTPQSCRLCDDDSTLIASNRAIPALGSKSRPTATALYELMFLLRRNDVTLERVRTVERTSRTSSST